MKRNFSGVTLKEVMLLLQQQNFIPWQMNAPPRSPSAYLQETLSRLQVFDLTNSEAAKLLLIDALFVEIVPGHPSLKVWKAAPLESDTLVGIADYVIAPRRAYLAAPLLCVTEAKRDDFEQGRTQCLAEMVACQENNRRENHDTDVFGIVSNGQGWQFYQLTRSGEVFETDLYTTAFLPPLLGALDFVCAECARRAASIPTQHSAL